MDEPRKYYAKWKKPDTKDYTPYSNLFKNFKRQSVDMESRWVMATGWMKGMTEKGHERTLGNDGNSLYNCCGRYTLDIFVKNHYIVQSCISC